MPTGLQIFTTLPSQLLQDLLSSTSLTSKDLNAFAQAAPHIPHIQSAVVTATQILVRSHPNSKPLLPLCQNHTTLSFLRFLERLDSPVPPHNHTQVFSCGRNDSSQGARLPHADTNTITPTTPLPPPSLNFCNPPPSVIRIAAGVNHSACITATASLLVAGANQAGQLGLPGSSPRHAWTPVPNLPLIANVACGAAHTVLLTDQGFVLVTGSNTFGQLGLGHTKHRDRFTKLSLQDVDMIAAGTAHSVLLSADGNVYAAGDNSKGQLGGPFGTNRHTFKPVCCFGRRVVRIACGSHTTMLLTADNMVLVTGKRSCGLSVIGGLGLSRVTHLSIGEGFAIVATDEHHAALSFHRKRFHVTDELLQISAKSVSAGISHYAVVTADGTAYAAGANAFGQVAAGQMGLTFTGNQFGGIVRPHRVPLSPVALPDGYRVLQVAAGAYHTLYLLTRDPLSENNNYG